VVDATRCIQSDQRDYEKPMNKIGHGHPLTVTGTNPAQIACRVRLPKLARRQQQRVADGDMGRWKWVNHCLGSRLQ
jgi:hypothetical protein